MQNTAVRLSGRGLADMEQLWAALASGIIYSNLKLSKLLEKESTAAVTNAGQSTSGPMKFALFQLWSRSWELHLGM